MIIDPKEVSAHDLLERAGANSYKLGDPQPEDSIEGKKKTLKDQN